MKDTQIIEQIMKDTTPDLQRYIERAYYQGYKKGHDDGVVEGSRRVSVSKWREKLRREKH